MTASQEIRDLVEQLIEEINLLSEAYHIEVVEDEDEDEKTKTDETGDPGFEPFDDDIVDDTDDIIQLEEWATPDSHDRLIGRGTVDIPALSFRDHTYHEMKYEAEQEKKRKERERRRRAIAKYKAAKMKKRFNRDVDKMVEKYRHEGKKLNMNKIVSRVKCRLRAEIDAKRGRFTVAECRTRETKCKFFVTFSFSNKGIGVGMECKEI